MFLHLCRIPEKSPKKREQQDSQSDTRGALILLSKLLLSLHALLLMAIEELVELAVDMVKPSLRDPHREQKEDSIPLLESAVAELKHIAGVVITRADAIGRGPVYHRALTALRAIENPLFTKKFTWGADQVSLNDISDTIAWFSQPEHGSTSLSYILQIKAMQLDQSCAPDERCRMPAFRKQFALDIENLVRQGHIAVASTIAQRQMFTPKILLQRTALVKQVLRDPRPDYLDRCGLQILCDARVTHQWHAIYATSSQGSSDFSLPETIGKRAIAFRFEVYMSSGQQVFIENPSRNINHTDRLGRTILHCAIREGGVADITTLLAIGADPHLECLNGFSLLHIAACHGHTTLMYRLLTERLDGLYRTPFWYAARSGHMDMIVMLTPDGDSEYLDIADFDPFQEDFYGYGALAIAARSGRDDVLRYLLKLRVRRTQLNLLSNSIYTEHFLLAFAIQSANRKCVDLVLKDRKWQFGDDVHKRAVAYAHETKDCQLQSQLGDLRWIDFPKFKL